jgi:hypothetical protein
LYWVQLAWVGFELTTLLMIDTDFIGIYKSNYSMITTTTAPIIVSDFIWNKLNLHISLLLNIWNICSSLSWLISHIYTTLTDFTFVLQTGTLLQIFQS